MKVCSLKEFMQGLKPWLSDNYIRRARLDEKGDFVLDFTDGVRNVYRIDDCTREQTREIIGKLKESGIPVEEHA